MTLREYETQSFIEVSRYLWPAFLALIGLLFFPFYAEALGVVSERNLSEKSSEGLFGGFSEFSEVIDDSEEDPTVVRDRLVEIDYTVLPTPQSEAGEVLFFNLFDDTHVHGELERLVYRSDEDYSWVGRLIDRDQGTFILTVNDDVVVINIRSQRLGTFQVRLTTFGIHEVREIDESKFPACVLGEETYGQDGEKPVESLGSETNFAVLQQEELRPLIDVMVLYTPGALASAGGIGHIQALINLAVDEANEAFVYSLVKPRLRVVHTEYVEHVEGDLLDDLRSLRNPTDGVLDDVHAWRDAHGADLVSLLGANYEICGSATLLRTLDGDRSDLGFSIVRWDCAAGDFSFAHELAHNMGAGHDRDHTQGILPLFPYSYGLHFEGAGGQRYRTIMSRKSQTWPDARRIQRISNPSVIFEGAPTGLPLSHKWPANNALTINRSAHTVSNWRATVKSLHVSPALDFISSGLKGGPFYPSCKSYTLTNVSALPLEWESERDQNWIKVNPSKGVLEPNRSVTVTICLNQQASLLSSGAYTAQVTLRNITSGFSYRRNVRLQIQAFSSLPFLEDFEGGGLQPYWILRGMQESLMKITGAHSPQSGKWHFMMYDREENETYSRNDITLGVDLKGYTNVVLEFWAKDFGDEYHGPAPTPFVDSYPFDGVAISMDGVFWYEVLGFRSLTDEYAQFIVPLDEAVVEHGLEFNSTFRIRFNQYDNFPLPKDGIALDNILITGDLIPVVRFSDLELSLSSGEKEQALTQSADQVAYTLSVLNHGPDIATSVVVVDLLPDGLEMLSTSDEEGFSNEEDQWRILSIKPDEVKTLTVLAELKEGAGRSMTGHMTEIRSLDQMDPDEDNNVVLFPDLLPPIVDVVATSSSQVFPSDLVVGQVHTSTWVISNSGPSVARAVSIKTEVQNGLELVGVTDPAEACTLESLQNGAACVLGDISPKASLQLRLAVRAANQGRHSVQVDAESETHDIDLSNNTSTVSFSVVPPNLAPGISLSSEAEVTLEQTLLLEPVVQDDGLPVSPGFVTVGWSQLSGPGAATFEDPSSPVTTVRFSTEGSYVLKLTAFDGEQSSSVSITVHVHPEDLPLPSLSVIAPILASSDDAEESSYDGHVNISSSDLEMVIDRGEVQVVGLRFGPLAVPPAALIQHAYLQFTVDERGQGESLLKIFGEATPDAEPFVAEPWDITSRPPTSAFVEWSPGRWNSRGDQEAEQRTNDLAPVIQEIVDGPGWASGNALALFIEGTGSRTAVSWDGNARQAPRLIIRYAAGAFASEELLFTAYNDFSWQPGQRAENITLYTTDEGEGQPPAGSSGPLRDYHTGQVTPVTLSVAGGSWKGSKHASLGSMPRAGTDAHHVFKGKVDLTGVLNYGDKDVVLKFDGLNPVLRYEVVVVGNRNQAAYTDRLTATYITGAESFINLSSPGSSYRSAEDATTVIVNGYNTKNGFVARFTQIDPGPDGSFEILQLDGGSANPSKTYINGIMIRAIAPSEEHPPVSPYPLARIPSLHQLHKLGGRPQNSSRLIAPQGAKGYEI